MELTKVIKTMRTIDDVIGHLHYTYFVCFGMLLHLIRDGSLEDDHDIDMGLLREEDIDYDALIRAFASNGYSVRKKVISDYSYKPFYIGLKHETLPPICLFFWQLHEGKRYHTYDINFENKEIPSEYVFKGVDAKLLDGKVYKEHFGTRKDEMFRDVIRIPQKYGSLLDAWYPNWLEQRSEQSNRDDCLMMKSCRELKW